ncbi:hypothetical protein AQUSIP_08140 [Aquicella siphonis]|uniref:Uncharacterized protein n=1 Tax=Aquicella siphonis TaxID=254247 RepID=A0A5E4PFA5_9COXI|nr:hypothetical protein [Aquicella siphonis]VVC75524.1 hypothetical protein AQUSIP_08140 [Aquicella siphonis]
MRAQEKSERGLPLSAADIQELLKDPNSWVSKLYAECQINSAMNEYAFIRFVENTMQEEYLALAREASADQERRDRTDHLTAQPSVTPAIFDTHPAQASEIKTSLQIELNDLLAISQSSMTATQLARHHQNLTANFSNQVSAQLGPAVTLASGRQLTVPQLASPPAPSAAQVLQPNPGLANQVTSNPGMQAAFATFHTQAETGPFAVFKKYREILDANHISDLGSMDKRELMRLIDSTVKLLQNNNKPLAEQLFYNNDLSLRLFSKNLNANPLVMDVLPSLTKPPAMFAVLPTQQILAGPKFGKNRPQDEEQDNYTPSFSRRG